MASASDVLEVGDLAQNVERSIAANSLFAPVEREILLVEENIRATSDVDQAGLSELLDYIVDSGGKRIRPALTLISGKLHRYNLDLLVPMAAGVELLHTATLVHDDTVDNSTKRRGKPTAANRWGGGTAILAGDYLFSQAAELVARTGNLRVISLFARTLMTLCKGELDQIFSIFNNGQSRQSYFRRIGNKTSSLFSTATESAGILSEAPEEATQALRSYGHNVGMAFQIVDDILDFTADEDKLGKPVASDLAQGILTLPAILLNERHPHDSPILGMFRGDDNQRSLELAIDMINNSDIIPECYGIARDFASEACQAVEVFPDSSCRQALFAIADHAVARDT